MTVPLEVVDFIALQGEGPDKIRLYLHMSATDIKVFEIDRRLTLGLLSRIAQWLETPSITV